MNVTFSLLLNVSADTNKILDVSRPWRSIISKTDLHIWFTVVMIMSITGAILFLLMLAVFTMQKKFRVGSGILLFHLIIVEMLLACFFFPYYSVLTLLAQQGKVIGTSLCQHARFWSMSAIVAQTYSALFMAINRLIAILLPHCYNKWASNSVLGLMIIVSWILGIGTNLPFYLGIGADFVIIPPLGSCGAQPKAGELYAVLSGIGTHIPVILVLAVYLLLFAKIAANRFLRKQQVCPFPYTLPDSCSRKTQVLKRRFEVARMLFISSVWYCVCFMTVPVLVQFFPKTFFGHPLIQLWSRTLMFFAYCTNPLIFFALNTDYRNGLKSIKEHVLTTMRTSTLSAGKQKNRVSVLDEAEITSYV